MTGKISRRGFLTRLAGAALVAAFQLDRLLIRASEPPPPAVYAQYLAFRENAAEWESWCDAETLGRTYGFGVGNLSVLEMIERGRAKAREYGFE